MRAVDIIMKKRAGKELTREEIEFLIGGYVTGTIPDYQVSAWAMAVYFQGMSPAETGILTEVMIKSGKVIDLSGIPGPFIDKHSTGGVGDKTSLILAPLVASLGIRVPMMSGRPWATPAAPWTSWNPFPATAPILPGRSSARSSARTVLP